MAPQVRKLPLTASTRRPLWRTATAATLVGFSVPAVIVWSLSGVGLLVLASTTPLLLARVRGRRNKSFVRVLGWSAYTITTTTAALMTVGLLLYNNSVTAAHVGIVASSATYLSLMLMLPPLLRSPRPSVRGNFTP